MLVNIRDDDTNFFTQPSELQLAYGKYLGTIPITLACTPFVSSHSFIMNVIEGNRTQQFKELNKIENSMTYDQIAEMNRVYPLGDNEELVDFIKVLINKDMFEIGVHGYNHRFYDDGAECIKSHANFYNLRDGINYFNGLFNTKVEFFIPPSNKIDEFFLEYVNTLKINLLTSGIVDTQSKLHFVKFYLNLMFKNKMLISTILKKRLNKNPFLLGDIKCLRSKTFNIDDTVESFLKRNISDAKKLGFISIATHYNALSENSIHRKQFHLLLECLHNKYDCKFVKASHLIETF